MSSSQVSVISENIKCIKLFVNFIDNKLDVHGDWSKKKLLSLLKNKLLNGNQYYIIEDSNDKTLNTIIKQGIFNEAVVSKLLKNGISKEQIIKAMKHGLLNLQSDELYPFRIFNITSNILKYKNLLLNNIDQELLAKLKNIGIGEEICLDIILSGLISQSKCCIFQLTLNGIAPMKILNWQGPLIDASNNIIRFLERLGVEQNVLNIVSKNGISEETLGILNDLGYSESSEDLFEREEFTYGCSLEIEEDKPCLMFNKKTGQNLVENGSCFYIEKPNEAYGETLTKRTNYLRKNLMAPLTWAMSRVLQYKPADPIRYIACQLIRWKYYIDSEEQDKIIDFVDDATIKRDKLLVIIHENSNSSEVSEESVKTCCQCCLDTTELHRIRECNWRCKEKWIPEYTLCELPQLCDFCKLGIPENIEVQSLGGLKKPSTKNTSNSTKEKIYEKNRTYSLDCMNTEKNN